MIAALAFVISPLGAQTMDTLFMNDAAGTQRVGRIVGIDDTSFKVEVALAVGAARATVGVPRAQVSRVEFAANDARDRLIASPVAANVQALGAEWRTWQPFLSIAKSPAAAVGNAYATALLATNEKSSATAALDIFKRVEEQAWNAADQDAARQGRLRAMVATAHAAEAVNEAMELAKTTEDPSVLIEAKFILAEAAQTKLRKLVEDNPRWTEDPLVRPEYERLYNEALDLYLHPYLFAGSDSEAAARGLWGAVRVYQFGSDVPNAVESARDLTTLYPGTRYAGQAQQYLDGLPAEAKKSDAEQEARKDVTN